MRLRSSLLLMSMLSVVLAAASSSVAGAQPTPMCEGRPATIVGTPGDDVLVGTSGIDVIVGLAGDDVIRGRAGVDFICGGDGRDRIFGGPGSDVLRGGRHKDRITGGGGFNWIYGEGGSDRLVGGPTADRLEGGRGGRDRLFGRGGNDRCHDAQSRTIRRQCEDPALPPDCFDLFIAPSQLNGPRVKIDRASGCPVITGTITDLSDTHSFVLPLDGLDGYALYLDWTSYSTGCPEMEVSEAGLASSCQGASLSRLGGIPDEITVTVSMFLRPGAYRISAYPRTR